MNGIRMKEVAERAGVSISTVSRALSAPERVSPDVRDRIQQAVRDLDYRINTSARQMRIAQTGVILVLLPDIGNPFFSRVLKGIEQRARELRFLVLIGDIGTDPVVTGHYVRQLDARRADGIILLNGRTPKLDGSEFGRDYPIVAVAERIPDAAFPTICIENRLAASRAVTFLARAGHRRIAHIAGTRDNIVAQERIEGYDDGLRQAGLIDRYRTVWHGDYSIASGRQAARALMGAKEKPTAIFSSDDVMAFGAIAELKRLGHRVPQDISIVGFDDIDFAEGFDPPLTTVRQPRFEMGRVAMSTLARRIAGEPVEAEEFILASELVMRDSVTGPAG